MSDRSAGSRRSANAKLDPTSKLYRWSTRPLSISRLQPLVSYGRARRSCLQWIGLRYTLAPGQSTTIDPATLPANWVRDHRTTDAAPDAGCCTAVRAHMYLSWPAPVFSSRCAAGSSTLLFATIFVENNAAESVGTIIQHCIIVQTSLYVWHSSLRLC